jgi:hypothetical protein
VLNSASKIDAMAAYTAAMNTRLYDAAARFRGWVAYNN